MNRLTLLSLLAITIIFTSCKKKCDSSNSNSGIIIENAIIKVVSYEEAGELFITDPGQFEKEIQMSLDNGITYTPVDYSQYSVFALTTTASCSSGYNKNITVNKSKETVTYTIDLVECSTCTGETTINNWVLTSKVPANYTPSFKINRE